MYSDSGDYIGGGSPRIWTPQDGSVAVRGDAGYLTVSVSGGASGDSFGFDFAAPPGQKLQPGIYDRAQRAPFRSAGRPGIDISGDGRGCNEDAGRFEVRDIAANPDGTVARLWIVYEQHCEGGGPATWGEVRIAEPVADGPLLASPSIVRWPVADLGHPRTVVPVTLGAAGATSVASIAVAGADPGDFQVRADE